MAEVPPVWIGGVISEQKDSPSWTFGDRVTCRRRWCGLDASIWVSRAYKGDMGSIATPDGGHIVMRVVSCEIKAISPSQSEMVINYDGAPDDMNLPPDEVDIDASDPVETMIEEHPRWVDKFRDTSVVTINAIPTTEGIGTKRLIDIAKIIHDGLNLNQIWKDPNMSYLVSQGLTGYDDDVFKVLVLRLQGRHVYASFPPKISIQDYSLVAPDLDGGGTVQTPAQSMYALPPDVEFMRHGDKMMWDWTKFRRTRTWQGAPRWSRDIYPQAG